MLGASPTIRIKSVTPPKSPRHQKSNIDPTPANPSPFPAAFHGSITPATSPKMGGIFFYFPIKSPRPPADEKIGQRPAQQILLMSPLWLLLAR
jgi:hypothetical protein